LRTLQNESTQAFNLLGLIIMSATVLHTYPNI